MGKIAKNKVVLCGVFVSLAVLVSLAYSHCQIPCGIYGDQMRFDMIAEHIATIEKSMQQITKLSAEAKANMNQVVRWVNNKEQHAEEIAHIVSYYFMAQRLKLPDRSEPKSVAEYVAKLSLLHEMLVYSMKAKQTTDLSNVEKLRSLLAKFHNVYYGKGKS